MYFICFIYFMLTIELHMSISSSQWEYFEYAKVSFEVEGFPFDATFKIEKM